VGSDTRLARARALAVHLLLLDLLALPLAAEPALLWRPCTVPELVAASDLVVQGRVIRLEPGQPGPDSEDVAVLRIDRVLMGSAPGQARDPALIRYEQDQTGIFFLRATPDGAYTAGHPARFKPNLLLAQILPHLPPTGTGG
jgi:hypothetical protein